LRVSLCASRSVIAMFAVAMLLRGAVMAKSIFLVGDKHDAYCMRALSPSNTRATHATTGSTSSIDVCQLDTLTRIARTPCHVVPVKNASPVARTPAITTSVSRS
jgi:hypothetical protein